MIGPTVFLDHDRKPINPQTNPQMNPQTNPQINPQTNPQTNPQMNPQTNPQINPQMDPQINPQMNPQINPQMNPQINPQINPQMIPQQFQNFNPWFNMMPPMSQEDQQRIFEQKKKQAREMGQILLEQKKMMEMINANRVKREKERQEEEIVLFFNHQYDILPLTFKANDFVPEVLAKYLQQSGKQNVKFRFRNMELTETTTKYLYEIEGLRSGEEIIVENK